MTLHELRARVVADFRAEGALSEIYRASMAEQELDSAWSVARALVHLGQANAEQQRTFDDFRVDGVPRVGGRLTPKTFANWVTHPGEHVGPFSEAFDAIALPMLRAKLAQLGEHADVRLRQDPATSTTTAVKMLGFAAQVLGMSVPGVELDAKSDSLIVGVPAWPPVARVGGGASSRAPLEQLFLAGHHLSKHRAAAYVTQLLPGADDLRTLVEAMRELCASFVVRGNEGGKLAVQATAKVLKEFSSSAELHALNQLVASWPTALDLAGWRFAVEATACRAGLSVSQDLQVAERMLAKRHLVPAELRNDLVNDVLAYSISSEALAVRRALGLTLGESREGGFEPALSRSGATDISTRCATAEGPKADRAQETARSKLPFIIIALILAFAVVGIALSL